MSVPPIWSRSRECSPGTTSTHEPAEVRTILVIDDQQLVASTLTYSLRDHGFDAPYLVVPDLEAVQTAALAHLPGLVLLDLDLGAGPGGEPMDGVDLIVPLRAQGWTVLVITGATDLDRIAEAVAHGAANWVVKGADFPELLSAVMEMAAGRGQLKPVERATFIERYRQVLATRQKDAERLQDTVTTGSPRCWAAHRGRERGSDRRRDAHLGPHGADPHPPDPDQAGGQLAVGGHGHRVPPSQPALAHPAECLAEDARAQARRRHPAPPHRRRGAHAGSPGVREPIGDVASIGPAPGTRVTLRSEMSVPRSPRHQW